jgi:hypothetical protein
MSQTHKIGKTATKIYTENGITYVKYHNTNVVTFSKNEIVLNTGGWSTVTTKLRMNQAAHQFGLEYSVFQKIASGM